MSKNDFAESVNFNTPALRGERDLASPFPVAGKKDSPKYTAKYGRFIIDEGGSPELESIMNDCLAGRKVLVEEKWYFTKDGDSVVVIKYLLPLKQEDPLAANIQGRRRRAKAEKDSV